MESWQAVLDNAPLEWLLEPDNPPVNARALADLLGEDGDDADVVAAKEEIATYPIWPGSW